MTPWRHPAAGSDRPAARAAGTVSLLRGVEWREALHPSVELSTHPELPAVPLGLRGVASPYGFLSTGRGLDGRSHECWPSTPDSARRMSRRRLRTELVILTRSSESYGTRMRLTPERGRALAPLRAELHQPAIDERREALGEEAQVAIGVECRWVARAEDVERPTLLRVGIGVTRDRAPGRCARTGRLCRPATPGGGCVPTAAVVAAASKRQTRGAHARDHRPTEECPPRAPLLPIPIPIGRVHVEPLLTSNGELDPPSPSLLLW